MAMFDRNPQRELDALVKRVAVLEAGYAEASRALGRLEGKCRRLELSPFLVVHQRWEHVYGNMSIILSEKVGDGFVYYDLGESGEAERNYITIEKLIQDFRPEGKSK